MVGALPIVALLAIVLVGLTASPLPGTPAQGAKLIYDQAIEFSKKGQYDQAIATFNQAIQQDPKNAAFYNARGLAYYYIKNYDKAIADFTKAVQIDPEVRQCL